MSTWYRREAEMTTRYMKDFQSRQHVLDQLIVETFLEGIPANVATWVRYQCDVDPEYACDTWTEAGSLASRRDPEKMMIDERDLTSKIDSELISIPE